MESLVIKKFGPILDVNLTPIKRFNIFIGESGSGKSTIMKVLAMMRWIYKMCCVRTYLKNSGIPTPFRFRADTILGTNGLKSFLHPESEILYRNGEFEIIINNGRLILPKKNVEKEDLTLYKISYISDKRVLIPDVAAGNVALRHNMFYLEETFLNFQKALDVMPDTDMSYLGVKMNVKKTNAGRKVFLSSSNAEHSFTNLPLTSASSGMQSSVALHYIMHYFSSHYDIVNSMNSTIVRFLASGDILSKFSATSDIGKFPNRRITVHIEEPELSLFPSNQWGLMKYLIGECLKSVHAPIDLTIATHSPYILTALNVMMLAKKASEKDSDAFTSLDEYCPLLDINEVGAWSVVAGRCESLLNEELGMIDGTYLDTTSDLYEDLILRLNDIVYG
ncbi:MAG: ATP-binding protein [Muribaculaceae bacterium]|nr:ATP-binding protein [Muribaculaceae bacterium]